MIETENKSAYQKYITSEKWYQIKIDILQIRGCKCEKCGKSKAARFLHIHHLTYERLFREEPNDLMILCAICHMKEHGLIKEKKKRKFIKKIKLSKKQRKLKTEKMFRIERDYKKGKYSYPGYLRAKNSV